MKLLNDYLYLNLFFKFDKINIMENYQHLNQKTESCKNKIRLHSPFNKNIQIQNFFRGDSNLTKQKNKIYNINSKKEIHFTSRPKEIEYNIKGPKILTINFPT